jgi:hypothetical protein
MTGVRLESEGGPCPTAVGRRQWCGATDIGAMYADIRQLSTDIRLLSTDIHLLSGTFVRCRPPFLCCRPAFVRCRSPFLCCQSTFLCCPRTKARVSWVRPSDEHSQAQASTIEAAGAAPIASTEADEA